jgi:hypothetical protein
MHDAQQDVATDDAEDGVAEPEPYEAARGPHLPDVVGRIPWLAWVFVILAVSYLVWFVRSSNVIANPTAADMVVYVLRIVPAVSAILLPAALLARHPDATSRLRTILFGTILFAVVQALLILAEPLQPVFESLTPASDELPFLVPLAATYSTLIGLVSAFGLAYIALGLSQARRYEDVSGVLVALFVPVATVLATIAGILAVSRLDLGDTPMSPPLAIYLGSSVVLGILRVAVWAYLAAVVTRGWRAGEGPSSGWLLGVLAAGLVLFALALVNLNGLLEVQDDTFVTIYGYVVAASYAIGHLCLLLAFAVGLPELDLLEDDEEALDAADAADVDEVVLDDDGWPVVGDPGR